MTDCFNGNQNHVSERIKKVTGRSVIQMLSVRWGFKKNQIAKKANYSQLKQDWNTIRIKEKVSEIGTKGRILLFKDSKILKLSAFVKFAYHSTQNINSVDIFAHLTPELIQFLKAIHNNVKYLTLQGITPCLFFRYRFHFLEVR